MKQRLLSATALLLVTAGAAVILSRAASAPTPATSPPPPVSKASAQKMSAAGSLHWPAALSPRVNNAALAASPHGVLERIEHEGLAIAASLEPAASGATARLEITDSITGAGIDGLRPQAWLTTRKGDAMLGAQQCHAQTAEFLRGSLMAVGHVTLNSFRILLLNDDDTITLLNPQIAIQRSRLEAILRLPGKAADWALNPSGHTLYVSVPEAKKLLVIDSDGLVLRAEIELPLAPEALAVSPDGRQLWVGARGQAVYLIDTLAHRLVHTLAVGGGPHALAFGEDERRLWIASNSGALLAVDTASLEVVGQLALGAGMSALSVAAGKLLVARQKAGELIVVDPAARSMRRLALGASVDHLALAPSGRWAFALATQAGRAQIIDLERVRLHGTLDGLERPASMRFSEDFVYFASADREQLAMVELSALERTAPALRRFSTNGLERAQLTGHAAPMATSRRGDELYVASPAERAVLVYRQGQSMAAGQIRNPVASPRAIMLVERSLEERSPGVWTTTAMLDSNQRYDLHLWLGSSRTPVCFAVGGATATQTQRHIP
ncbi:MAG: hypothetical protein H0U74_18325 [Bradymonadaceae bacterium]|nr:hypothetical protein [Lujinxingiaceae bacterium]